MVDTKKSPSRGRPRQFDPEQAVAIAQRLFHARGYDAVSVSDVAQTLGINPPSFYAAFGSKAGLYARVLDRYAVTNAVPLGELLRDDRPVAQSLAAVLESAARLYAANTETPGCLVLEGTRCDDPDARDATRVFYLNAQDQIRRYVAARHPDEAERVTDFVSTTMAGLSAQARNGLSLKRLLAIARLAAASIDETLRDRRQG